MRGPGIQARVLLLVRQYQLRHLPSLIRVVLINGKKLEGIGAWWSRALLHTLCTHCFRESTFLQLLLCAP